VGCLSLAVELQSENFESKRQLRQDVEGKLNYLVSSRPTAVNMKIAADELIMLANKMSEDESTELQDMKSK
jgi:methylthioribose-1-phosphate isomerase